MSTGPITIFDKSSLESLNLDEAVWFQHFYRANITPLFYVETLADLEKQLADGRSPEQVVGQLAEKTPFAGAVPNVHHERLALNNLMGEDIPFRGVPVVGGGRHVRSGDRHGVVYSELPEMEAFKRWQAGRFLDVEREFARQWRSQLQEIDLEQVYADWRPLVAENRPSTLEEARDRARTELAATDRGDVPLMTALDLCNIPDRFKGAIRERWTGQGRPSLDRFAPYTAHVATVEMFFCLAIASDLIGRERPSNHIDIAYLHYLPFCMVFTSKDRLHARTVPVFLRPDQSFVHGEALKRDLARLDAHYAQLPDDVKAQGVWRFAPHPPKEGDYIASQQWDRFLPAWRERDRESSSPPMSREQERELVQRFNAARSAPAMQPREGEPDFVILEHKYRVKMGKWRILPPGVEKQKQP